MNDCDVVDAAVRLCRSLSSAPVRYPWCMFIISAFCVCVYFVCLLVQFLPLHLYYYIVWMSFRMDECLRCAFILTTIYSTRVRDRLHAPQRAQLPASISYHHRTRLLMHSYLFTFVSNSPFHA